MPYVISNDLARAAASISASCSRAGGLGSRRWSASSLASAARSAARPITVMYLAWALGMLMTAGFGLITAVWQAHVRRRSSPRASISLLIVIWYTLLQRLVPDRPPGPRDRAWTG